jgi:hypothetical protein
MICVILTSKKEGDMLKIKAFGVAGGIIWALAVIWVTVIHLAGKSTLCFDLLDQCYLGLLMPTYVGLIVNAVIGFIDGFIGFVIFAWIYNKVAG